jgi:hypothetical protein
MFLLFFNEIEDEVYLYRQLFQIYKMQRRTKYLLVFSIIYWLIVFIGIALFSVSFQKVPVSHYGLRANYFNPTIDPTYYTSGLYDVGVGYYFINFPSTKQQIIDDSVTIINQNLEKLTITYSLFYRYSENYIA